MAKKKNLSISEIIRGVGRAAGLAIPKAKQTRSQIMGNFNRRIRALQKEGWKAEELPPLMTKESTRLFTDAEVKKIASSALKKNSAGVYQIEGQLMPEIRRSYEQKTVEVINARNARMRRLIGSTPVTEGTKPLGFVRGEMINTRDSAFKDINLRPFERKAAEDWFLKNLFRQAEREDPEQYRKNLIVAIQRSFVNDEPSSMFKDQAEKLIATIQGASLKQLAKAYYKEEKFDITYIYELEMGGGRDNLLAELLETLRSVGAKEREATDDTRRATAEYIKISDDRQAGLAARMQGKG